MHSIPRIETERLNLRAIYPADVHDLFEVYADVNVAKFYDFEAYQTIAEAHELIDRFTRWFQTNQAIRWGIFGKEDQRLLGTCCFDNFRADYHSANLGYNLRSDHWGKGLVTEACTAIVQHAFRTGLVGPINRIQAITDPANERSEKVLRRIGFQFEGLMRSYGFWKGHYRDMKLFSLLKSDQDW